LELIKAVFNLVETQGSNQQVRGIIKKYAGPEERQLSGIDDAVFFISRDTKLG
jgi:hypothetical protein